MPEDTSTDTSSTDTGTDGGATSTDTGGQTGGETGGEQLGDSGKRALDAERAAAKAAQKELRDYKTQVERERRSALTDAERALAEAEDRGKATATTAFGQRLARTEFVAAAAKRNPTYDASAVLDDLNLARYVGDDGEPDTTAIGKAVERLVPAGVGGAGDERPSFDGGTRSSAPAGKSMNDLIRAAAGRA